METRSKKRKRQRLISMSSYHVSPQGPDVPAIFESLNDDTLTTVLEFVGNKSYAIYAGINKHCREIYLSSGMAKETFLYGYCPLSVIQVRIERATISDRKLFESVGKGVVFYNRTDVLEWALQEEKKTYLLRRLCSVAVKEARLDLLNKVWNNLDNVYHFENIFDKDLIYYAANCGKLSVLKWYEIKESHYFHDHIGWAYSATSGGQIHILKWLREEKGLKLFGDLYNFATDFGGQLRVMKWLREQEVSWAKRTFYEAAKRGNLEVLQWLQDEGCPWPVVDDNGDVLTLTGNDVKPEALEWLLANGYRNRIVELED